MRRIDARPSQRVPRNAAETLAHFIFGGSAGVAYALSSQALLHLLPGARRVPAPVRGAAYGLVVWALSYGVGIPPWVFYAPTGTARGGRPASSHLYVAVCHRWAPGRVWRQPMRSVGDSSVLDEPVTACMTAGCGASQSCARATRVQHPLAELGPTAGSRRGTRRQDGRGVKGAVTGTLHA